MIMEYIYVVTELFFVFLSEFQPWRHKQAIQVNNRNVS